MFYLLWAIINIGIALYFIGLCFWAASEVKKYFGRLTFILFVFGLLSYGSHKDDNPEKYETGPGNTLRTRQWKFAAENKFHATDTKDFVAQNNWVHNIHVTVEFGRDSASRLLVPVSAFSSVTGLSAGTDWVPRNINVTVTNKPDQFRYSIEGTVEWKLGWATVFTQNKTINGVIDITK